MEWLKSFGILIGRILLVLIFLRAGIGKVDEFSGTAQYMASHGIAPYTNFFLVGAIFFELVGSVTVISGYFTRFGAILLLFFLIPTTYIFHNVFTNPNQDVWIQFMKNVGIFGGLLVLLAAGAGRFSLDYLFRRGKKRDE
ncbi:MAG TPA: DoxX family protein [Thermodesulfobacteriota bacterium]|nr:DoxX family protein [Thermodesulfobacteriota bacterium]